MFTIRHAENVMAIREAEQEKYEFAAFMTGQIEGHRVGFDAGMRKRFFIWYGCMQELIQANRYNAYIIKQTGYKEPEDWRWDKGN